MSRSAVFINIFFTAHIFKFVVRSPWFWRRESVSEIPLSPIFIGASILENKVLFCTLLWQTRFLRAAIQDVIRWWRSALRKKIERSTRFDEIETKMGECKLQYTVLYWCPWRSLFARECNQSQINLNFWKMSAHSNIYFKKSPACQKAFSTNDKRSLHERLSLVFCIRSKFALIWLFCWRRCHLTDNEEIGRLHWYCSHNI